MSTGGRGEGGGSAMASVLPSGTVGWCTGACPLGRCDNDLFFANVTCSSLYPGPVSPTSTFCNAGQTGSYCLRILLSGGGETRHGITCTDGVATGKECPNFCNSLDDQINCQ
jgi:hypothetical protein